jgi:hypothetical protein
MGDLILLARVISNSCAWQNSASGNCCAINRLIHIQWHSVFQFLASSNTYGTFKQTGLRFRQANFVAVL